jgi:anti-sigma B factor antagonist
MEHRDSILGVFRALPRRHPDRRHGYSRPVDIAGTVEGQRIDGGTVLALEGEHDLSTAPAIREALDVAIANGAVIIDLTRATFVDSSILGVVLDARRRCAEDGKGFAVSLGDSGHDSVRRVLEVTGLLDELPVHESRELAISVAGFAAGPP